MEEIWKGVIGYEKYYEVSNKGHVRSLDREIVHKRGKLFCKGCEITGTIYTNGYVVCTLTKGIRKTIHRMVAEVFIPRVMGKDFVDHINGIRTDNRVENLRWVTNKENQLNPVTRKVGSHYSFSKEVQQYTIDGELVGVYESTREAARAIGKPKRQGHISVCCLGRVGRKIVEGFVWKYSEDINK